MKWIITVLANGDTRSITPFTRLRDKLYNSGANLIVIGIGLPENEKPLISKLGDCTPHGLYIDCPNTDYLETGWRKMVEHIMPN